MTNPALSLPDLPAPTLLELPASLLRTANQPLGAAMSDEQPLLPGTSEKLLGLLAVLTVVSGLWWGLLMLTISTP